MEQQNNSLRKTIITKILGVLVPQSFTHDLLNYFQENVEQYLKSMSKDNLLELFNKLRIESIKFKQQDQECPSTEAINNGDVVEWMVEYMIWVCKEKKVVAHSTVNEVQAVIWGEAFKSNKIKVPFYEDVLPKLKEWKDGGIKVFTVSHGSVAGQEAYFKHSQYGDVSGNISGYIRFSATHSYDSFVKMAKSTETGRDRILFLTNDEEEAKQALIAGISVNVVLRESNETEFNEDPYVKNIADIIFKNPKSKKRTSSRNMKK